MSKTVLVTGGAGFIGSHTAKALAAAHYHPVVYDNLERGHADVVRWGPLEVGDIADCQRLDEVFAAHKPDAVMHFAAYAYVGESNADPLAYYRNNVAGSLALIERALAHGINKIVFSSSCATYGMHDGVLLTEDMAQRPINPYGRTKLMIEEALRDIAGTGALHAVALRYFNAAGASLDGDLGEDHDPETHLIPLVLMAARDPQRRISIFGTDYDTADGTCVRDYVHVEDLADAHVAALNSLFEGAVTGFKGINLGTGRGLSVREIIAEARRLTNYDIKVEEVTRRPGDPAMLVADPALAAEVLGWQAKSSDIETIIRSTWAWLSRGERP